jgi:hypothetical protein
MLILAAPLGIAISATALFVGYVSAGGAIFPRYLLPVLPVVAVLAGPALPTFRRLPFLASLVLVIVGWVSMPILLLQEGRYFDPIDMRLTISLAIGALCCLAVGLSRAAMTATV